MNEPSSADIWGAFWRPWTSASLAPDRLWQSINPGWTFGNVTINERNSSSPQTEQAIVAEESYGRQIGKLLDAVTELVKAQPDGKDNPAYTEVAKLKARIDRIKCTAATKRINQLHRDLELLRDSHEPADREAYRQHIEGLRALLLEPGTP